MLFSAIPWCSQQNRIADFVKRSNRKWLEARQSGAAVSCPGRKARTRAVLIQCHTCTVRLTTLLIPGDCPCEAVRMTTVRLAFVRHRRRAARAHSNTRNHGITGEGRAISLPGSRSGRPRPSRWEMDQQIHVISPAYLPEGNKISSSSASRVRTLPSSTRHPNYIR